MLIYMRKMLKETETEETIDFSPHFYHWRHFNWEQAFCPLPTLWVGKSPLPLLVAARQFYQAIH